MLDAGQSLARHIPINSPEIAVSSRMRLIPIVILAAIIAVAAGFFIRWQADQADAIPAGLARANGRIEAERVAVATKYAGRDALKGRQVEWAEGTGTAAGIDRQGNLLVESTAGCLATLNAGEVHLSLPADAA